MVNGLSQSERSSLELYRLKKELEALARKEGRGTELVSLYIPPGKQISEVLAMLRDEYGTASNIKSDSTRNNVQDAITKVQQKLKLFKQIPKNGLVIFSGAIPQNGPGSERMETYIVEPLEPINVYLYRCDPKFHLEYLQEQLREKETYGIILLDANDASFATLRGKRLEIVKEITSGVPGKFRAGGQSAARFERQREAKLLEYFNRVGQHANDIFLQIPDLKGVILGGPGPTKYDFEKGDHLNYNLKKKIISIIDTAYVSEQGVDEILERAPEILRKVRYLDEKKLVQDFLYHVGHDTGLATYGEDDVRHALQMGAVKTLLLSEGIDIVRVTIKCTACGYKTQETVREQALTSFKQKLISEHCSNCKAQTLTVEEVKDVVDELAELAEHANAEVEMISTETEEGQMLKNSFGGIAAILRFKLSH
jgi:peptide chain release factor subunit 1